MTRIVRGPEKEGGKTRSPFVISLCFHGAIVAAAGIMLALSEGAHDLIDRGEIFWIDNLKKEQPVKRQLKPKPVHIKKDREISFKDPKKLMEQAKNKRTEVEKFSNRILPKDALNADLEKDMLPDVATDADLPTDVTGISRAKALPGRTDGIGDVTGRARVAGDGKGIWADDSLGNGDGLVGGGPGGGLGGNLPWLDGEGPGLSGRVAFVLDVSASMAAAGLYKLELAKDFLVDQIHQLEDTDDFNIITFAGYVSEMEKELVKGADEKNMRRAIKFLSGFTQESITDNRGTNTLAALEKACAMQPEFIVLLTDGLPTGSDGLTVMTDPQVIVDAFRKANTTKASLYIFGLEIDDRQGAPGAILLNRLAASAGGKVRFISRDELIKFKQQQVAASR